MVRPDLSMTDASARASSELSTVLSRKGTQKTEKKISVAEALRAERVAKTAAHRSAARVLFISQDTTLLNPSTQSLDGFLDLKDLFEEVHVLILREGIPAIHPVLRVAENVWLYTATAKTWFMLPRAGRQLINEQLVFASGFRPDLIIARDPFESGLVGKALSTTHDRPLQVHVLQNYSGERFKRQAGKNFWRRFLPGMTIPAATSVRTDTADILDVVQDRYEVPDLALLPKYYAYDEYISATTELDLKKKYPQYSFFYLFVGGSHQAGTLFEAIDALRFVLQNKTVALVVIGNGAYIKESKKRAKALGILDQIIFIPKAKRMIDYYKAADVLIVTDPAEEADEIVLTGAAAGIPVVCAETEGRLDFFEHGVSALLCLPDNVAAFSAAAEELLNNQGRGAMMAEYAQGVIKHRFHRSAAEYRMAFQRSIEETLFVAADDVER